MSKFFLALFFSFLLAKLSALNMILKDGGNAEGIVGSIISFLSNVLSFIDVDKIPVFEVLSLPSEEATVIANTLITYTPIFYFFILFGGFGFGMVRFFLRIGRKN